MIVFKGKGFEMKITSRNSAGMILLDMSQSKLQPICNLLNCSDCPLTNMPHICWGYCATPVRIKEYLDSQEWEEE